MGHWFESNPGLKCPGSSVGRAIAAKDSILFFIRTHTAITKCNPLGGRHSRFES